MKKLTFLLTGFMIVSLVTYSKNPAYKTGPLNSSPVKGFYSIGKVVHTGGKSLMLKSVPVGKDFYQGSIKGYYGIADNIKKLNESIFQAPAGTKKMIIKKGYYSQVH